MTKTAFPVSRSRSVSAAPQQIPDIYASQRAGAIEQPRSKTGSSLTCAVVIGELVPLLSDFEKLYDAFKVRPLE